MSERTVLIVDDEDSIRNQLRWGLADEYEVITAANLDEARRALRDDKPSVVALDVTLSPPGGPSEEGLILLDEIVDQYPHTKVIMVTGNESREIAFVRALVLTELWQPCIAPVLCALGLPLDAATN